MKREKGWFKIPGVQDGDRTLDQQLRGLDAMLAEVSGKVVLDLGAAEGLISNACMQHGAAMVHGIELVPAAVAVAKSICPQGSFTALDLNGIVEAKKVLAQIGRYDVCLMLAILHKLQAPLALVATVLDQYEPALIVVRTAARTPGYVQDDRSSNRRYDFHPQLLKAGYTLTDVTMGPFKEWMGYYRK